MQLPQNRVRPPHIGAQRPAPRRLLVSRRAAIAERRGRNVATVAVARKLLTLAYYVL